MNSLIIYTPTWHAFGGGEKYLILLAMVLSDFDNVSVALVSDNLEIQKSSLEHFSGADLSKVNFINTVNSEKLGALTDKADICVQLSTYRAATISARRFVQVLQIPYGKINLWSVSNKLFHLQFKEAIKDIYRIQLHSHARKNAVLVLVYSNFVKDVLFDNFGVRSEVLYPPIQDFSREGIPKNNTILSVGRIFEGLYNNKRYDVLTKAFRQASRGVLNGWEYHIAGSVSSDPETQEFLRNLREENKGYAVYFHVNESYDQLAQMYNEAAIFWHAAGFNINEGSHPENTEHFGMTTVEAMSAGCIPVVANKGGQREIITEGIDGYMWDTTDELIEKTASLINNKDSAVRIREQGRKRFEDFNLDRFRKRVSELFSPLLR